MALRNTIGSYAKLQLYRSRAASRRAHGQTSCDSGGAAQECPPCPRAAPPPCRARPAQRATAARVVCCPPPAGHPPPCSPPCAPQPLTCADALPKSKRSARAATCDPKKECGLELDRVARRLAQMEQHRRLEYEKEVAAKKACREPFPELAPYSLSSMRECCRATDGRDYALACRAPPPPACGPDRTPPPPQGVELMRDNECQVRGPAYVDPCAHKPRTIVQIDRSGPRQPDPAPEENAPAADLKTRKSTQCGGKPASAPTARAKKFTKRLMESLSLSKAPASTCPRRTCDAECEGEGAKRAGDSSWCSNMKPPPAVPPPCREPTPTELLKRRPTSRCGPKDSRCFHTAARADAKTEDRKTQSASQIKSDTEKLEKVLKDRENYDEAGRGRVVVGENSAVDKANEHAASLDICVPPGAEKLSVRVSLDKGCSKKESKCKTTKTRKGKEVESVALKDTTKSPPETASTQTSAVSRCRGAGSELPEKRESWLSIKSLLSSCRKGSDAKHSKKDSAHTPTWPSETHKKSSVQASPCKPTAPPSSSKAPPATSPSPGKFPVPPIPCYPPFPSSLPEKPQPCKSPADTLHKAPVSAPCKPPPPPPSPKTDCPPSKPNTDGSPSKPKTVSPPSKPKTVGPPSKSKTDCPPSKPKTDYPPFEPKTDSPSSKPKTDCPPSKPKDPCSTNKTKFLADKELQLQSYLLKW